MKALFKKLIIAVLTVEARIVLGRYRPVVIAVTGSVGKTSTKDAIAHLLKRHVRVRKSPKSFNAQFGIPLTVLNLPNRWNNPFLWLWNCILGMRDIVFRNSAYPEYLVLEVGAERPGDIRNVARWLKPRIVVVTRFPDIPVHVAHFSSPRAVIEDKLSLVRALADDGALILNHDDSAVLRAQNETDARVYTYGVAPRALIRAEHIAYRYHENGRLSGMQFKLSFQGRSVPVRLPNVVSPVHIYAALAAFSVEHVLGFNLVNDAEAITDYLPPPGRMRLLPAVCGAVVLDDSYNSSPAAAEAALEVLASVKVDGKRYAVLGDMLELGSFARKAHLQLGRSAARSCDVLLVVGSYGEHVIEGARAEGMPQDRILYFEDSRAAGKWLRETVHAGDVVLVKGSQGVRMERAVAEILHESVAKNENLVRQDVAWRRRD